MSSGRKAPRWGRAGGKPMRGVLSEERTLNIFQIVQTKKIKERMRPGLPEDPSAAIRPYEARSLWDGVLIWLKGFYGCNGLPKTSVFSLQ